MERQAEKEFFSGDLLMLSPGLADYYVNNQPEFVELIHRLANRGRNFFSYTVSYMIENYHSDLYLMPQFFVALLQEGISLDSSLYSYFLNHFMNDENEKHYVLAKLKFEVTRNVSLDHFYRVTELILKLDSALEFLESEVDSETHFQVKDFLRQILSLLEKLYSISDKEKIIVDNVFVPVSIWVVHEISKIQGLKTQDNAPLLVGICLFAILSDRLYNLDLLRFVEPDFLNFVKKVIDSESTREAMDECMKSGHAYQTLIQLLN